MELGLVQGEPKPTLPTEIIPDAAPAGADTLADTIIEPAGTEHVEAPTETGNPEYQFKILARPVFCCNPLSIDFEFEVNGSLPAGAALFDWDFGDGTSLTGPTPTHTYLRPDRYEVSVTAQWPFGLVLQSSVLLDFVINPLGGIDLVVQPAGQGEGILPTHAIVIADAGRDLRAFEGERVTMDGSNSRDLSGDSLDYSWAQVSGADVVIHGADEAIAAFEAPAVDAAGERLTFELNVSDGDAVSSDRVNITVFDSARSGEDGPAGTGSENHAPIVEDGRRDIEVDATVRVTLRGTDQDGDGLVFRIIDPPSHGSLAEVVNGPGGTASVRYTPEPRYVGIDTFTFRASDGMEDSNLGTFHLRIDGVSNASPIVSDLRGAAYVESPAVLYLEGIDPDGDRLTFTVIDAPTSGRLGPIESVGEGRARVVYTPDPGVVGEDSFTFAAFDGTQQSQPAAFHIEVRRLIIPWLEVNVPDRTVWEFRPGAEGAGPETTFKEFSLVGLEHYAAVTDTAVVTTRKGNAERLYGWLRPRLPQSMRLVGGVKTSNFIPGVLDNPGPYDFADLDAWEQIAAMAQQTAELTGQNAFLLENEGALWSYHTGEETIDLDKLRIALGALRETGVEIWWGLPMILEDSEDFPDRRARTTEFVRAIAETLPDCRFLGGYTAWHDWKDDPRRVERRLAHAEMIGWSRLQARLFVTSDGYWRWEGTREPRRCFTEDEGLLELENLSTPAVNVYPGARHWFSVARRLEELAPYDILPVRP